LIHYCRHILFSLIIIMLCSCASEIILPDDKLSSKLVVLGELEAHEPISFRIGKSIPLTHQSALKFQDLDEADIIVSNSTGAFYNFHAEVDSLTEHLHTLSARYNSVVTPDLFYTVKVKHSSYDSVYCITYIPPVPYAMQKPYYGAYVCNFPMR
jgi:hypothetical protein